MNLRRFLTEAGTLVGLAVVCALVSNGLAGKERKLAIPGDYPNATKVTARPEARPLAVFEEPSAAQVPAAADALPAEGVAESGAAQDPVTLPTPIATVPAAVRNLPPDPTPQKPSNPSAELLGRFPVHGQPFVEITGEAAAWLHARGALFLDARRSKEFGEGHVAGARSFPVWESEVVRERVGELVAEGRDPSLPVVLYCSGGDCEDSHMLAQTLFGAGFENLLVYRDGFPDWVKRGGPARAGGPA